MHSASKVIDISNFENIDLLHSAFEEALRSQEMAFVVIDEKLYCLSPASFARDAIAAKIAKRLAEEPTILHDIQTRLESEKAIDWE